MPRKRREELSPIEREAQFEKLTQYTRPRSRQVSHTPFEIPQEHLDEEYEKLEYRESGFHDPVTLRRTETFGYDGVLDAEEDL